MPLAGLLYASDQFQGFPEQLQGTYRVSNRSTQPFLCRFAHSRTSRPNCINISAYHPCCGHEIAAGGSGVLLCLARTSLRRRRTAVHTRLVSRHAPCSANVKKP
jgi:hypothetical protein